MSQDTLIRLQCTECKEYNYHTNRNTKNQDNAKLDIKKFCKRCRAHKTHKERGKK